MRDSFVTFQPPSGKFKQFDHMTLWVGNAKQVSLHFKLLAPAYPIHELSS